MTSQSTIAVYIPFLANVPTRGPCGGYGRLKRYVSKAFAKPDSDGAMTLGTVKKVEIVVRKNGKNTNVMPTTTKIIMDDDDTASSDVVTLSAYVKFIPSGTKACSKMIDEINSDDGLKFVHNTNKLLFWNIHRQRKQTLQQSQTQKQTEPIKMSCPLCGHACQVELCGSRRPDLDDILSSFEGLTCDDQPNRKRFRR